ncbi:MAG: YHS domain-containing protein [Sedimentisphaerales bacterium]
MKNGMKFIVAAVLVGIVLLAGCQKKSEPVAPSAPAIEANAPTAMVIEQTICPVMGGAINKEIFAEYQGKKVYFCCPECKGKFEKEPEKYISELPQFKK